MYEKQLKDVFGVQGYTFYYIDEGYHCYDEYTKLRPMYISPVEGRKYDFKIRNCDTFYHKSLCW